MLKDCKLYVIVDSDILKNKNILKIAEGALRGGADIIQLRDKSSSDRSFLQCANEIKKLAKKYKRLFLINDRVDIAHVADADGVHIGQDDLPIEEARKILGAKIIGVSTHNLKEAKTAEEKGADYIGIGPVFKSKTKKGLTPIGLSILRRMSKPMKIPFFAIGGISLDNIPKVKKAGVGRVAVVSSAIKTKNVYLSVRRLKEAITSGDVSIM